MRHQLFYMNEIIWYVLPQLSTICNVSTKTIIIA